MNEKTDSGIGKTNEKKFNQILYRHERKLTYSLKTSFRREKGKGDMETKRKTRTKKNTIKEREQCINKIIRDWSQIRSPSSEYKTKLHKVEECLSVCFCCHLMASDKNGSCSKICFGENLSRALNRITTEKHW